MQNRISAGDAPARRNAQAAPPPNIELTADDMDRLISNLANIGQNLDKAISILSAESDNDDGTVTR